MAVTRYTVPVNANYAPNPKTAKPSNTRWVVGGLLAVAGAGMIAYYLTRKAKAALVEDTGDSSDDDSTSSEDKQEDKQEDASSPWTLNLDKSEDKKEDDKPKIEIPEWVKTLTLGSKFGPLPPTDDEPKSVSEVALSFSGKIPGLWTPVDGDTFNSFIRRALEQTGNLPADLGQQEALIAKVAEATTREANNLWLYGSYFAPTGWPVLDKLTLACSLYKSSQNATDEYAANRVPKRTLSKWGNSNNKNSRPTGTGNNYGTLWIPALDVDAPRDSNGMTHTIPPELDACQADSGCFWKQS